MSERVAIVGARDCSPETEAKVREYVRGLPTKTIVVSGGARGVDSVAEDEASKCGLGVESFCPSDENPGGYMHIVRRTPDGGSARYTLNVRGFKVSGAKSNRDMLIFRNTWIALSCDRMVAFVEGSKGGTWDAVKQAERFRRPCEVIR